MVPGARRSLSFRLKAKYRKHIRNYVTNAIWGPAFCMWNSLKFRNGLGIRDPWESELFFKISHKFGLLLGWALRNFLDFLGDHFARVESSGDQTLTMFILNFHVLSIFDPPKPCPLRPCPDDRARNSVQDSLNESSVRPNPTLFFFFQKYGPNLDPPKKGLAPIRNQL